VVSVLQATRSAVPGIGQIDCAINEIEFGEIVRANVHFSTNVNIDRFGKSLRDAAAHGCNADILRGVIAGNSVTARGNEHESTRPTRQRERDSVDFDLDAAQEFR
jgi:hypothetical protein